MIRKLLSLVLTLSASPLFAYWTIAPRTGPSVIGMTEPRAASNGIDYLVAWSGGSMVRSQLVRSDGSLQGEVSQPVDPYQSYPQNSTHPRSVSVTRGRDGFFLAWLDDAGVHAAITDSFGRIEHRSATVTTSNTTRTMAAWNGAAHCVLTTSSGPFSVTIFDNNGDPIASDIPIGNTHGDSLVQTDLTADSAGFLVVSTKEAASRDGRYDLYGRRISSSGVAGDWFFIRSIFYGMSPSLALTTDGTKDIITWGTAFGLWAMTLDPQTNSGESRQLTADAASVNDAIVSAERTWIAYTSRSDSSGNAIVVAPDGSVSAPIALAKSGIGALASNGANVLAVHSEYNLPSPYAASYEVDANFISGTTVGPSINVARTLTGQARATLAAGHDQLLTVWDELLDSGRQVFAARGSAAAFGGLLDAGGIQLSSGGPNFRPSAASNGTNYFVVWLQETRPYHYRVVGRRFSQKGEVLDSQDLVIGEDAADQAPRVASDGHNWLVVWIHGPGGYTCMGDHDLLATRVSADGVRLDGDGVAITENTSYDQSSPDLSWNGTNYVAAWKSGCLPFHGGMTTYVGAALLAADLTSIRASRISLLGQTAYFSPVPSHTYYDPHVSGSLIAWQHSFSPVHPQTGSGEEVEYVFVDGGLPSTVSRRRVAGGRTGDTPSIAGTLFDVQEAEGGKYVIVTTALTTWTKPQFPGIFESVVTPNTAATTPAFKFIVDAVSGVTDYVIIGTRHCIAEIIYDVEGYAPRLRIRDW